ncbi:MAG: phosphatidylserine/phosphatidylglycerophosphate/cardiolipin synthase family protein [Balneolaceae bacterium]|nr:MAG: phosphatidylserine/phosphatidylglycerophosphate/cardiolipin synthase family protein [Balneolaceae bacterium]
MRFEFSLKTIVLVVFGLFIFYLIGSILFFNATPKEKRVTEPIFSYYSVDDGGFVRETGLLTGRNWVYGNDIEVIDNGEDIFDSMIADIRSATRSITKETYNFWGEKVATTISEELAEAARRGVSVHFIMDFVGSRNATGEQLDIMREAGVELVRWRKPAWYQLARLNHRTHRKILVVDGATAYMGGANTADDWIKDVEEGGYKDYHYRITGPIVNEIQGAFSENWVASTGRLLTGTHYYTDPDTTGRTRMQVTSSNPREGQKKIRKNKLYLIASARENIRLAYAYFFPDHEVIAALVEAAERGVLIQTITPGEKIDQKYLRYASQNRWGELLRAGVEMFEYRPGMYHTKLMIVDDAYVSIGSSNFDNRSFRINDETNLNILDKEFSALMVQNFENDLKESDPFTYSDWENRPLTRKFSGWITQIIGPQL